MGNTGCALKRSRSKTWKTVSSKLRFVKILQILKYGPVTTDTIKDHMGISRDSVSRVLHYLKSKDMVEQYGCAKYGIYYRLKRDIVPSDISFLNTEYFVINV
mgnify:FL=1